MRWLVPLLIVRENASHDLVDLCLLIGPGEPLYWLLQARAWS
jgi:hypothetical protein